MKEFFVSFFFLKAMLSPTKSRYNFLNSHAEQTRASQMVLVTKNPPASAGDIREVGLILGSERSPGKGNDNPLQYSCLENPMDRRSWLGCSTWGRKESDTTEGLNNNKVTQQVRDSGFKFKLDSKSKTLLLPHSV